MRKEMEETANRILKQSDLESSEVYVGKRFTWMAGDVVIIQGEIISISGDMVEIKVLSHDLKVGDIIDFSLDNIESYMDGVV